MAHNWMCFMLSPWVPTRIKLQLSKVVTCLIIQLLLAAFSPLTSHLLFRFTYIPLKPLATWLLGNSKLRRTTNKWWSQDLKPGLSDSKSLCVSLTPTTSRVSFILSGWQMSSRWGGGLLGVRQMHYIDVISWQLRSYPSYVKGWINWIKHEEI